MKNLLLAGMLLISISVFSQDTTKSKTPILDKTEKLVDKYSSKIADVFIATMETAKPVAKEGFRALVWYQIAKGIGMLLPLFLFFLFTKLSLSEYRRIDAILVSEKVPVNLKPTKGVLDQDNLSPVLLAYLLCTIICAVIALFSTYSGVLHIVAPKWYAVKDIVEMVK